MHVHGDNLQQKELGDKKYADKQSRLLLAEIRVEYDKWKAANAALEGPVSKTALGDHAILEKRTLLFSAYKEFIDQQRYAHAFDSRSNLHSSVLEEFIYYLFRDLVAEFSNQALIGKAHTFKDVFFMAPDYASMVRLPHARVERKDHDFAIGVSITVSLKCQGQPENEIHTFHIPAVAIECKTYLDKTMLEGASTAAEQLKLRNPNGLYFVVCEWLKLTGNVNLRKYKTDQIYVLRKQRNTDREFRYLESYKKNPVYLDVVEHLFNSVRTYLLADWQGGVAYGLDRGYLL